MTQRPAFGNLTVKTEPPPTSLCTFEYWHNMFGKDADRVPGAKQFTPVVTLAVHLPMGGSGH